MTRLLCQVETDLTNVSRRETKSILRERGYPGMSALSFQQIFEEMSALCPIVHFIVSQMMQEDTGNSPDRKAAAMALIYDIIMFSRCKEMSLIQRVNTVLLTEGNASEEVINCFKIGTSKIA